MGEFAHAGLVTFRQPFAAVSASLTKPFICPPLTSAVAFAALCGPPPFTSAWSTEGGTHWPVARSGAQTVGTPFCIGMPAAPG